MQTVTIEDFPGLDFVSDPGEGKGAIDLLNVVLLPGVVKTRPGSSVFATLADPPRVVRRVPRGIATDQLIVVTAGAAVSNVIAYDFNGTSLGTTGLAAGTVGPPIVSIGTPTNTYSYVASTFTAGAVKRWDGATWTAPAAFATFAVANALAVTPSDNRLVFCSETNKVAFSDAGAPEVFGANNYVRVTPGDGETIAGAAVFNNQVFVFKQSRFFVFYGQSTDATGQPVFNYRTVDTGIGLRPINHQALCVAPDGVYFVGRDGIYKTTGGAPVKVSGALEPRTGLVLPTFYQGGTVPWNPDLTLVAMQWMAGNLFVASTAGVFVLDVDRGVWTFWTPPTTVSMTTLDIGIDVSPNHGELLIMADLAGKVRYLDVDVTTDVSASSPAIVSRYRSAFSDFGSPSQKRLRQTLLEGTGTPTLQWSTDWGALTAGSAVSLGVAPAIAGGRQRIASRGQVFSFQLGASSGAWAVNNMQAILHPQTRPPGITVQP